MNRNINIQQLKNELSEARQQLAFKNAQLEEAHVERAAETMDQTTNALARELALQNLDRRARQFGQIEAALQRLNTGDFGICVDCDEEIGAKRLQAIPWAERCVACQELHDRKAQSAEPHTDQDLLNAA
jgi:DnaK suppressor protein